MSGLTLPRIIFSGTTSWNPNTVNNGPDTYDEIEAEPVLNGQTFAQYAQKIIQFDPALRGGDVVGSWNVFGDYGVKFAPVTVTGVEPAASQRDPLIGKPVQILSGGAPRMVDTDPFSPFTTSVIYHTFSLGDESVGVSGPGAFRISSRWPNFFGRNLASRVELPIAGRMGVVWQAALPKRSLTWYGTRRSPALAALREALEADRYNQGLIFLFASYRTIYYQTVTWQGQRVTSPKELAAAYQSGFKGGNPALSATLGRVAVWGPRELASTPTGDLYLTPVQPVTTADVPQIGNERPEGRSDEPAEAAQAVLLGPAQARLDRSRSVVVLDFLATFPEADPSLKKVDVGSFILQVVSSDGQVTPIGAPIKSAQYNRQAYESGGGIVEVSFADDPGLADVIAGGTLELVSADQAGTVALRQLPLVAETDQRGLWLDEATTETLTVQTYQNGATPPSEEVQLLVVPYDGNFDRIQDPSQAVFEILDDSGGQLPLAPILPVGPDGSTTFTVRPLQAGICYYVFFPFTGPVEPVPPDSIFAPPSGIAPQHYYAVLRALPFDNELNETTPDSALTWQFIYQNVLSTWDVVYPLMSTIIPLSNEQAVNQAAAEIGARLKRDPYSASRFMPISRDMSAGKRKLLLRYLALQSG